MNILLKEHVGSVSYISLHNQRRDRGKGLGRGCTSLVRAGRLTKTTA